MREEISMIFVSLVDKKKQKELLDYFFQSCTDFSVKYPNQGNAKDYQVDNPLLGYKSDFLELKKIDISPWNGMENSMEICGKINNSVKDIFYNSLKTRGIWNYSLLRNNKEIFIVSDFDDGTIILPDDEIEKMKKMNII